MQRLDVDFVRPARLARRGWALCGLLAVVMGWVSFDLYQRKVAIELRVSSLAASADLLAVRSPHASRNDIPPAAGKALHIPWDLLFNALNRAAQADVVVDTLTPDAANQQLFIDVNASSFDAIKTYLDALAANGLRNPQIKSEALDESTHRLRYRVEAGWPSGRTP